MGRCAKDFPAADTNILSGMPKVTCCGGWRQGTEVMEDQLLTRSQCLARGEASVFCIGLFFGFRIRPKMSVGIPYRAGAERRHHRADTTAGSIIPSCRSFSMTTPSVGSVADVISLPPNTKHVFCSSRWRARPVFLNFISIAFSAPLLATPRMLVFLAVSCTDT